jgi:integrase
MARVPGYRLHKASGQAIVTLSGRDYYLGAHGSPESRKKYNRLLAEYLASDKSPSFGISPEELNVNQVLVGFLKHAKQYYKANKKTEYGHYIRIMRKLKKLYGDLPANAFGPVQYKAIRQTLLDADLARYYINSSMKRIVRIFRWASGEGLIPASLPATLKDIEPLKLGRSKARETEAIKPVADEVVDATLPFLPPVVRSMVEFQQLVGCRPGEVCLIKPSMINRTSDVWEIRLSKHKGAWRGRSRTIYVGKRAQEILLPYLLRNPDDHCFRPWESEKKRREVEHDARVTPLNQGNKPGSKRRKRRAGLLPPVKRKPGQFYDAGSYGKAIARACLKAFPPPEGLSESQIQDWNDAHRWTPNQLRHSVATKVRQSDGLDAAATILGHSELGVTQVYAEADRAKAIEVVRRIG